MEEIRAHITGFGSLCALGPDTALLFNGPETLPQPTAIPDALFATELSFPAFIVPDQLINEQCRQLPASLGSRLTEKKLSRTSRLCFAALGPALNMAALSPSDLHRCRVGVALGTTVGCTFNDEQFYLDWRDGSHSDFAPLNRYLHNNLAHLIQDALQITGPSAVITNACASGTDAIGLAKTWIENDLCDIAIAGGADELSRIAYHGFASLLLLSDAPCRPFAADRRGLNLGEGAGILILEGDTQYKIRKARPLGRVIGYGVASDCFHPTAPHPDGRGLVQAVNQALSQNSIGTEAIGYVNAHGTGTAANDATESVALAALNLPEHCPVVSSKGTTGHTLGAAGAIETILTLKTLQQGHCPGTVGCRQVDPALPRRILAENESCEVTSRFGINQSLAFGGGNSALVVEAFPT
jgi:3-oxoacyl-[acyl-carrier-protein] synthase-1/3-oxoacyl-[acyl-carrier-protein] synthase II